jgi:hypothetical protein
MAPELEVDGEEQGGLAARRVADVIEEQAEAVEGAMVEVA